MDCYPKLLHSFFQWIFIDHILCASHCSRFFERQQWTNNTSLFSWRSHLNQERQWENKICHMRVRSGKMIKAGERDREWFGEEGILFYVGRSGNMSRRQWMGLTHTNNEINSKGLLVRVCFMYQETATIYGPNSEQRRTWSFWYCCFYHITTLIQHRDSVVSYHVAKYVS